jgi:hypothetical protein
MRYFRVRVSAGKLNGLYNIYYNTVSSATIASQIRYIPNFLKTPAINVTYAQLTNSIGVLVEVPDNTTIIIVKDNSEVCTVLTKVLEVYAKTTKTDVTVSNGKNGTIIVESPVGGVAPYQVKLDDYPYESLVTSVTYTGLSGGEYFVYIKDSTDSETIITVLINEPEPSECFLNTIIEPNPNLSNGIITLNSIGGSWPKTYELYRDTSFPYNDACGDLLVSTYTGVTEQDSIIEVTGLSCGYYCLVVTNSDGGIINSGTVNICPREPKNISYPILVKVGDTLNNACAGTGGSITIYSLLPSVDGLVTGYQYFDEFGSPLFGPTYNYWSHPENCNVGTIDNFGYFNLVQNCTNCF